MNARNILARAIAVGATAVVVATGLPTASWAAGSASVISGSPVLNEGSHTAVFGTSTPYPPSPVGPDVQLVRHADSSDTIDDSSSSVDSNGHVVATFDLSNANPGAYDVNIGQANTQTWSDQCTSCFTIVAFHPTVSSVSPAALGGAALYQPFVISGQHFTKGVALSSGTGYVPCVTSTGSACGGPTVAILKHGTDTVDPDVTLTQTVDSNGNSAPTSTTPTAITMRAGVVSTAVAHVDDVLVTNTDGKTGLCAGCLTIGPRPVVSSVLTSPNNTNEIGQGATNATVVVTGTNFSTTDLLAVAFHGPSSNSGAITYKSESAPVNVGGGNQAITLTGVDTTGVTTTGAWTVTVFDSTLHTSSAAVPFPVNAPPNPNAITYGDSSKSAYGVGAQLVHLTVTDKSGAPFTAGSGTGTGFTRIVFPSGLPTGVTVGPSQSASGGAVSAVLSIAQNTPVTSKIPVALVNPDGGQAACDDSIFNGGLNPQNSCFLNIEAGPGITSVSPNTVASGSASGPITIKGTNFNTGAGNTVHVTIGPAQAPWFDSAVTPTNATTLTVPNVAVPVGTAVGNYDVTVRNDTDKGTFTAPGAFHVASLSVSGVSDPNPLNDPGDNPDTMTVNGNNFASGATVTLTKAGLPTITGTVNSVNANGHSLSATFNFTNVAPGPYDVNVTNPSNSSFPGTASCPGCLTVVASAPSISNVNPNALGGGASNVAVTVTGANIFPGATLVF
ncbi:MAG: hypothetical protein JO222_02870, partial [Frankiales bacterium]|nr:hypothetical protein [Frankiales bacterium]